MSERFMNDGNGAKSLLVTKKKSEYRLVNEAGKGLGLVNRYLSALEARGLSIHTVRAYAYDLLVFLRWLKQRKKPFKRVTGRDLARFIEHQRKLGAKPASINRRLSACETFFRFCYGKGIPRSTQVAYPMPPRRNRRIGWGGRTIIVLKKNPAAPLRVKNAKPLIEPLEVDEVNRFLSLLSYYRDTAIVLLMLFCGLRSCEILSLKIQNVDFEKRRVKVWGKGNKERMLPLPDTLIASMKKYLRFERPDNSATDHFFVVLKGRRRGDPLGREGLRKIFRYRRGLSGIEKARPHNFRHAFGTNMARNGVSLPVLQKMMGHAEFKTTLRYINMAMNDVVQEYTKTISKIEEKYES